jgi:hypothetical protein
MVKGEPDYTQVELRVMAQLCSNTQVDVHLGIGYRISAEYPKDLVLV